MEKHISKCTDARRIGDWKSVLREVDAAASAGADSSPQVCTRVFFDLGVIFVFSILLWSCDNLKMAELVGN